MTYENREDWVAACIDAYGVVEFREDKEDGSIECFDGVHLVGQWSGIVDFGVVYE